jgi:hydrogenase maturation protease
MPRETSWTPAAVTDVVHALVMLLKKPYGTLIGRARPCPTTADQQHTSHVARGHAPRKAFSATSLVCASSALVPTPGEKAASCREESRHGTHECARHALVIGYGNPLREDDGIGRCAAEILERNLPPGAAEIIQCHQLTPELAAKLENASVALFLDAAFDQQPGAVSCVPIQTEESSAWSHQLSPGQLLVLAQQLNGQAPPAFLIRGGILRTGLAENLTEIGERAAAQMADVAHAVLSAIASTTRSTAASTSRLGDAPGSKFAASIP